jgi:hypothetical protein
MIGRPAGSAVRAALGEVDIWDKVGTIYNDKKNSIYMYGESKIDRMGMDI